MPNWHPNKPQEENRKCNFVHQCYKSRRNARVVAEHVNRRLKIWRILGERYRNRRRRLVYAQPDGWIQANYELALA